MPPAPSEPRIVLLGGRSDSVAIIYHALQAHFGTVEVILEEPVEKWAFLRRRFVKLGLPTVLGQLGFMALLCPILKRAARDRVKAIRQQHRLCDQPIPEPIHRVKSVNAEETRRLLCDLRPSVVVLAGTRIVSRQTLEVVGAPFINMHAGITPRYRGVHGGYWALVEGKPDLVGTTIHLVDLGIDTGTIIAQARFPVTAEDSFATYPYLHYAAGLPLLIEAVREAAKGTLCPRCEALPLESKLWSHPTIWGYLESRFRLGVK